VPTVTARPVRRRWLAQRPVDPPRQDQAGRTAKLLPSIPNKSMNQTLRHFAETLGQAPSELALNSAGLTPLALANALRTPRPVVA
jgi:hypothetical protein